MEKQISPLETTGEGEEVVETQVNPGKLVGDFGGVEETEENILPTDSILAEVQFEEDGPLGVILKRKDGVCRVEAIQEQAIGKGIAVGDELWSVGTEHIIGGQPLDKDKWDMLVSIMKATRPLKIRLRRRLPTSVGDTQVLRTPTPVPAPDSPTDLAKQPAPVPMPSPPPNFHTSCMEQLEDVASRLVFSKENSKHFMKRSTSPTGDSNISSSSSGGGGPRSAVSEFLVKPGRRLVREGEVDVCVRGSLWNSKSKRLLFLFDDLLLLAIPASHGTQPARATIEHCVELQAAKIFSHAQSFIGGGDTTQTKSSNLSFEIQHPGGVIEIIALNSDDKEVWVLTIFLAICELLESSVGGERGLGWKHQVMLGTMHSAVTRRDLSRVQELLASCESGEIEGANVEAPDHDGYTPLHYACLLRLPEIVRSLHASGADVTVTDNFGLSPLHMSALQLDDLSLSLLLANLFDPDLPDRHGRTPLYLACSDGRAVGGLTDPHLLRGCLGVLLALGADPDGGLTAPGLSSLSSTPLPLPLPLPVHLLASSWQSEPLLALLQAGASVNTPIGKYPGGSALHLACVARSLKPLVGLGAHLLTGETAPTFSDIIGATAAHSTGDSAPSSPNSISSPSLREVETEPLNSDGALPAIRALLQHGALPNLRDTANRSPLQVLAESQANWKAACAAGHGSSSGTTGSSGGVIRSEAAALLVGFGARLDDSAAWCVTLRSQCSEANLDAAAERWNQAPPVNADLLGLRLNAFEHGYNSDHGDGGALASVMNSGPRERRSTSPDGKLGNSSNGSNSNAPVCNLCGVGFTLFRRQHHCRLCNTLCCDDCSRKRAILEGSQQRACDGCFNVVLHRLECLAGFSAKASRAAAKAVSPYGQVTATAANTATTGNGLSVRNATPSPTADAHLANRTELFAGAGPTLAGATTTGGKTAGGLAATMGTLNEVGDRLRERGQKLEKLSDRSAEMANAASDFAKLAKQLNEQQRRGGFW